MGAVLESYSHSDTIRHCPQLVVLVGLHWLLLQLRNGDIVLDRGNTVNLLIISILFDGISESIFRYAKCPFKPCRRYLN